MSIKYKSLYFEYEEYPFVEPPEARGNAPRRSVIVVGAGPVGLVTALGLVRQGVEVTVLEDEVTLNIGSRAAGTSRRSLEILDSLGVDTTAMEKKGVMWSRGQSYYGEKLVLDFSMPVIDNVKHPPMINLQQCYVEKFILDELVKSPLATLLWSTAVKHVENVDDHVVVQVDTPAGPLSLQADWVVACDGARSVVRSALGLTMEGRSYEGRYIVADVRLTTDLPPGRRVWFDSPGNPGSTIILHRQPDNIWRIDYQLRDDEDSTRELEVERVQARIQVFLDAVGIQGPWEIDWVSLYRAHSLSLREYKHGHVLFAGDAAHLVPIFGARGMNSGIDDAHNLAWKLACVIKGQAAESLLASYTGERHYAFDVNISNAEKSTKVMAPPTRGDLLLRDAVLELAVDHPFVQPLLNPRQTQQIVLAESALNDVDETPQQTPAVLGNVCPDLEITVAGHTGQLQTRHLQGMFGPQFTLLYAVDPAQPDTMASDLICHGMQVKVVRIAPDAAQAGTQAIIDADGAVRQAFGLQPRGAILIRPDHHIMARWASVDADKVAASLRRIAA